MPLPDGTRVWHIERLTDEFRALFGDRAGGILRFRELPLVSVPAGNPRADAPPEGAVIAESEPDAYGVALSIDALLADIRLMGDMRAPNGNRWIVGVEHAPFVGFDPERRTIDPVVGYVAPAAPGFPGALNLSLQTWPGRAPGEHSPISVATKAAAEVMPVVVAAGNWRQMGSGDTLNPLGKLPWVISVAATRDEQGTTLVPTSSAGEAGRTAPTLTAWGKNGFVDGVYQTSFAAPRVTRYALYLRAFLLQVRSARITHETARLAAVPLVVDATIDSGYVGYDPRPQYPIPMLPYSLGIDVGSCQAAFAELDAQGVEAQLLPTAGVVTTLLLRSARTMPFEPHEVGAGFISDDSVRQTLSELTWSDLLELTGVSHADAPALRRPIARAEDLELLFDVTLQSRVSYGLNFKTGAVHTVARPPFAG